jgi:hypothetical protein
LCRWWMTKVWTWWSSSCWVSPLVSLSTASSLEEKRGGYYCGMSSVSDPDSVWVSGSGLGIRIRNGSRQAKN